MRERNLFLAITIPDDICPACDDPDDIADEIVRLLNNHRTNREAARRMLNGDPCLDGVKVERIMVNAIPSPQWLTADTLRRLRVSAAIDPADIRSILTAYDNVIPKDCWGPWRDRLAETVGHGDVG